MRSCAACTCHVARAPRAARRAHRLRRARRPARRVATDVQRGPALGHPERLRPREVVSQRIERLVRARARIAHGLRLLGRIAPPQRQQPVGGPAFGRDPVRRDHHALDQREIAQVEHPVPILPIAFPDSCRTRLPSASRRARSRHASAAGWRGRGGSRCRLDAHRMRAAFSIGRTRRPGRREVPAGVMRRGPRGPRPPSPR